MQRQRRDWRWLIPWVTGLALAVPVLVTHYPPMTDLPLHEAVVSVLAHFREPAFNPGLYEVHLGHPNQLFVLGAYALSFVFAVPTAVKIAVALTVLAICVSAGRFAAHLK